MSWGLFRIYQVQSNLVKWNSFVTLKLFLNAQFSLLWSELAVGQEKGFLIPSLTVDPKRLKGFYFSIKPALEILGKNVLCIKAVYY